MAIHDKVQFGFVGQPIKRGLTFVKTTLLPRAISGIISGGVNRSPGVQVVSNIFLRDANAGRTRRQTLSVAGAFLPIFRDQVDASESVSVPPTFLGLDNGLLRRPRLWMARAFMNVKFGPKTRPC